MTRPRSLRQIGLKKYLNDTAGKHRGLDYAKFVELHEDAKIGPNNLARAFNVSKNTMLKWLSIHNEEKRK